MSVGSNFLLIMVCLQLAILCVAFSFASTLRIWGLPDTATNPFRYLEKHKYPYENHTITTEDGYILLAVRLLHGKTETSKMKRPPILVVHGLFATFYDFLNSGPDKSLGFELLEEGYDVWLLNTRGSTFSRKHLRLDPVSNAREFFDFSWHELGIYDVSATIDHIINATGVSKISYVGHSQGCTSFFTMTTTKPEYNKKITFAVLLAPTSYLTYSELPIGILLKGNLPLFELLVKIFKLYEILPHRELYSLLGHTFCHPKSIFVHLCVYFTNIAFTGPSGQTNDTMISVLATNDPAGGSAKEVTHYTQVGIADKFQWFDYGKKRNMQIYHQESPPLYHLSKVTVPVALFYGQSDFFVSVRDGERLNSELPNSTQFVLGRDVNHGDVLWGINAVETVHRPAIKLLNKFNKM